MKRIEALLEQIYPGQSRQVAARIQQLIEQVRPRLENVAPKLRLDETDSVLITYGDMVQRDGEAPLRTLYDFLTGQVAGLISIVHLLPFYPSSSDDGFAVIDYLQVDPALGGWEDIERLADSFRLMFDAVINHASQQSEWFQQFRQGHAPFTSYFKAVDPLTDLSDVFRPRALPLLTAVETATGVQHLWTTFSADQIDLNYESPDLLLEILAILLRYVEHKAALLRLDAIGFMWKVPGTRSLHLPQTHALIQLMRAVLDEVARHVVLITETNVPHEENISYFGDGFNEAQMVYNFSLPPLTLHAFHTGDASRLARWANALKLPSNRVTFFNFLASHDGIGVTPARGILSEDEIDAMAERVKQVGGFVSYKANSDGSQSAYELNINYLDALSTPDAAESEALLVRRFLTAQAIMLSLRGVPGIYFHSLFGSRSWPQGSASSGRARTINRQKLQADALSAELAQPSSLRRQVLRGYRRLLQIRAANSAFHPYGKQKVHELHDAVFAVERRYEDQSVLCLHNVSDRELHVALPNAGVNLFDGSDTPAGSFRLEPYAVAWIEII